MLTRLLVIGFFAIFSANASFASEYVYDYNANCSKAYQCFLSLHPAEGYALIKKEIIQNPNNLVATYVADYEDCLLLLFNGDKNEYEQRKVHMDARLDLLSQGDQNSPWFRLCQAGVYLHWALVHLRYGENLRAATTFRRSYILLKENQKLFPAFEYNNVFLGLEQAVVGAVPEDYRWLASIFGMKGNVKRGEKLINDFLNTHSNNDPLRMEAVIYNCYLKFYLLSKQAEVWSFLNSSQFSTHNNLLYTFLKGNLGLNYRKADMAAQTFKFAQMEQEYSKYPVLDYELGSALYLKQDVSCISYFNKFIARYKGRVFIKDAWQKMAFMYYLQGDIKQANYCRQQIKETGSATFDADKQANRFARGSEWPDKTLLRARLFIDGGFYTDALTLLKNVREADFKMVPDKMEYDFRMGRANDEGGMYAKALQFYQSAINLGQDRTEQFAARAALQMGLVYEKQGDIQKALSKYHECLSMRNHDFQATIDEQAKAGINRLSVK